MAGYIHYVSTMLGNVAEIFNYVEEAGVVYEEWFVKDFYPSELLQAVVIDNL